MPKRKRSETEDIIDQIEDRAVRIKASRLNAKIDHGNKILKNALDLATAFERQKMGRRQKQASQEPHKLLRLREEVIVLKELKSGLMASNYLFKQLAKTKRIKESPAFVALYGQDPKVEPNKSVAESNVLGRLFKANPVKEVMPGIMEGIKQVLKLDEVKAANGTDMSNADQRQARKEPNSFAQIEDGFAGCSDHPADGNDNEATSTDDELAVELDDNKLKMYEGRIAGSSDEDDDLADDIDPMEISDSGSENGSISQDSSRALSDDKSGDDQLQMKSSSQPAKQCSMALQPASTSFLPSLSMGGYYSGSESENDDYKDANHGPALPKERKNRRGQRERQRIAELKFGKDAKHLQKQAKNRDRRSDGWDVKRGAVDSNKYDSKQRRIGKGGFMKSKGPTGANGETIREDRTTKPTRPKAKKDNEGALHPSWEAAKKRKQESKQVAFEGKKITFD